MKLFKKAWKKIKQAVGGIIGLILSPFAMVYGLYFIPKVAYKANNPYGNNPIRGTVMAVLWETVSPLLSLVICVDVTMELFSEPAARAYLKKYGLEHFAEVGSDKRKGFYHDYYEQQKRRAGGIDMTQSARTLPRAPHTTTRDGTRYVRVNSGNPTRPPTGQRQRVA